MKKKEISRLAVIMTIGVLVIIGTTNWVYMAFSQSDLKKIPNLEVSHQRIIQSKSDTESLDDIKKEMDEVDADLNTTDMDANKADLESIDLTGV